MWCAVICEGKTDAILASFVLCGSYSWVYQFKTDQEYLQNSYLETDSRNETLHWYFRESNGDALAIWGAGGYDSVSNKLGALVERNSSEMEPARRFQRILLLVDRDDRRDEDCIADMVKWCRACGVELQGIPTLNAWMDASHQLRSARKAEQRIQLAYMVLPPDESGFLEVFLLRALAREREEDRKLVESSESFVSGLPTEPYLIKSRYRPKAALGCTLSVISPEWVAGELANRLRAVQWEDIRDVQAAYNLLAGL